ncbi:hypothetical protein AOL_s00083g182 [Orbilia oligospora ATCC 24927]|uniref:Uncharacterized protein n=1 Tax=Arthrobotrys oligospora (strain ATCC 24927 / CBS 115.81 / DSM 1491) TaxID=756982 RepID=G1XGQ1_ARTOA|nr:hypothetical protein AOL_s00083g182 [Orbilia oligospora ATCC 24927]EGX47674.1 hypothetical protein AOL_s00083g182 [Orbilia oligospora ATCC 24927]
MHTLRLGNKYLRLDRYFLGHWLVPFSRRAFACVNASGQLVSAPYQILLLLDQMSLDTSLKGALPSAMGVCAGHYLLCLELSAGCQHGHAGYMGSFQFYCDGIGLPLTWVDWGQWLSHIKGPAASRTDMVCAE